ncbi:MAG TPA: 16S rRNA (guanine(527)-N(7))-methyltransferase RsmG [Saprospiraceae bacterium]|nr:16S rRNA (guanine(527)-N(7))-methyltransferase RsmG [Saprospiraceae bacterium]
MPVTAMEVLKKYFPDLSSVQLEQFGKFCELFAEWNAQINLISRKDIDNLEVHHVLHSLAIAKNTIFEPGTRILDLGTGGGFPGIPMAILLPELHFTLMDSIGKKIMVVNDLTEKLGLTNVQGIHSRVEDHKAKYDFVVTRAVADISKLLPWTRKVISGTHRNGIPNGLLALKGATYLDEIKNLPQKIYYEATPVSEYFDEEYFKEKFIVYYQA